MTQLQSKARKGAALAVVALMFAALTALFVGSAFAQDLACPAGGRGGAAGDGGRTAGGNGGLAFTVPGFAAALFGGFTSLTGTMLGGVVLGVVEAVVIAAPWPAGPLQTVLTKAGTGQFVAFVLIIVVLSHSFSAAGSCSSVSRCGGFAARSSCRRTDGRNASGAREGPRSASGPGD